MFYIYMYICGYAYKMYTCILGIILVLKLKILLQSVCGHGSIKGMERENKKHVVFIAS